MDEIETRLPAATESTLSGYVAWRKDPKDAAARSTLMESVHELRKIAARLEIEMAVSERDEMAARPIPIPPHRSSRKASGENMHEDNIGNAADEDDDSGRSGNRGGGSGGSQGGFRGNQGGGGTGGGGQGGGQTRGGPRRRMGMSGPQGGGNNPPRTDNNNT